MVIEVHTIFAPLKRLGYLTYIVLLLGSAENMGGNALPRFNPIISELLRQIPKF